MAIPSGMITNELVSNALKHAFSDGRDGDIIVAMLADGDQCTLVVKDNGVGFPEGVGIKLSDS